MQDCSAGDSAAYQRRNTSLDDVVIVAALRTPLTKVSWAKNIQQQDASALAILGMPAVRPAVHGGVGASHVRRLSSLKPAWSCRCINCALASLQSVQKRFRPASLHGAPSPIPPPLPSLSANCACQMQQPSRLRRCHSLLLVCGSRPCPSRDQPIGHGQPLTTTHMAHCSHLTPSPQA
jgi:hypothetical protein